MICAARKPKRAGKTKFQGQIFSPSLDFHLQERTSPDRLEEVHVHFSLSYCNTIYDTMTDFLAESLDGNAYLLEEFVDQSFVDDCAKDDLEELTNVQLPLWDDLSPGELYDLLAKENAGKNLPWTKLLNKQWGCIGNALLKVLSLREAKPGIDKSMKVGKNSRKVTSTDAV